MNRLLIITGCALLVAPVHAAGNRDLPSHIRIQVEYIDAPHETVTEIMQGDDADSGPKLHARMRALVKEKKARIIETSILTARPGQKATLEAIAEYIYPSDYDPGDGLGGSPPAVTHKPNWLLRAETPLYFQTRNLGVTLEIEPSMGAKGEIIDLRLHSEIVNLLRLEKWVEYVDEWGDASLRKPVIESLDLQTGITLLRGKFAFLGLLTPTKQDGGPKFDRKIMVFVRANVIPIEVPAE